ncbi:MAG: hypothetical protein WAS36_01435, partial [Candidatus Saccharimonadales bacterium]
VLLITVYFFTLQFLPGRRLVASMLAISVLFSGFLQWWYFNSTLACLSYPLLIALSYIYLLKAKKAVHKVLLSFAIAYTAIAFGLLIYPPFQIPVALVLLFFILGYTFSYYDKKHLLEKLAKLWPYLLGILVLVFFVMGAFVYQNRSVVATVQNTAYPGKRIVESGGYSPSHLASGQLAYQFKNNARAKHYINPKANATNQSESSTFFFLSLYLAAPLLYLMYRNRKDRTLPVGGLIISMLACGALFMAWLFVPHVNILGSLTFLNLVPQNRLIIGLGLLDLILIVLFMKMYSQSKFTFSKKVSLLYALLVLLFSLAINLFLYNRMPGFVRIEGAILLSLPIPLITLFVLLKKYELGLIVLALFSIFSSGLVNPVYKGTDTIRSSNLVKTIEEYPNNGRWIVEDVSVENFVVMANKKSLSGVFTYPQLELWNKIDNGKSEDKYNRYAHVSYNVDRTIDKVVSTGFVDTGPDQLVIKTELCSTFIRNSGVRYAVSTGKMLPTDQKCIKNIEPVKTPNLTYYIYSLRF